MKIKTCSLTYVAISLWIFLNEQVLIFINENQDLFIKKDTKRNGYVSYVMIWDGGKEGWIESDRANKLREKFIQLLQKNDAHIYHIIDDPYSDHPYLFSHYDKYSKEIKVE